MEVRDLTNKIKQFFQAAVMSILLYGCTTLTLTKRIEKKLNNNYTRMLWTVLNKSWRQHSTKQQLYGHLPLITKTIQIRQTRHVGHCWRSKDKLISNVILWTHSHGWSKVGWPTRTYIQQLCADTGCSLENLLGVMDNRDGWQERVRKSHASNMTWWYIFGIINMWQSYCYILYFTFSIIFTVLLVTVSWFLVFKTSRPLCMLSKIL